MDLVSGVSLNTKIHILSSMIKAVEIKLRPLILTDSDRIFLLISRGGEYFNHMYKWPKPYTKQDAINFVERSLQENESHSAIHYAIIKNDLCGMISLYGISSDGTANLGYWVSKHQSGKGVASKALKILLKYAKTDFYIRKIFSSVLEDNIASKKVLEKHGFKTCDTTYREVQLSGVIKKEFSYSLTL
jgi:RimJ/RimL family protein N-acetyltransferase